MGRIVASFIATLAIMVVVFAVATEVSASVDAGSRAPMQTFTPPVPHHPEDQDDHEGAAEAIAGFFNSPAFSTTVTGTVPFSVTADLVADLHEQGLGFGEIFRAINWAILSGKTVTEVVQLHESGMGWGEIRQELNLDKRQARLGLGKALHEFRKGEQTEGKGRRGRDEERERKDVPTPTSTPTPSAAGATTTSSAPDHKRAGGSTTTARGTSEEHRAAPGGKSAEHRAEPGGKSAEHRADSSKSGTSGQSRKR